MPPDETTPAGLPAGGRPFRLEPFRGLRFSAERVGDLATVISPPYDVLDADTVRRLEQANRRNVVRLILSRRFERPYLAVRDRLLSWRERGYLRADPEPSLYVYEYTAEQTTVRGLVGLVALREEHERVVLPHEDVMEAPVEDRAVLMRTTRTNLEPILLVHTGSTGLHEVVAEAAATAPVADVVALDGSAHRLWRITDVEAHAAVAREVSGTQALIADGHHRYAAYQRLQAEQRGDAAAESSPWDFGLALLVDQADHPMHIGPIHRSVAALTLADVRELSEDRGDVLEVHPDRESALHCWAERPDGGGDTASFVIADGQEWGVLRTPRTAAVDAAVLHQTLLPAWRVAEEQLGYHHSLDQALAATGRQPGLVVAVRPPTLAEVMATAARGERLPRKSTSFAPKPRMGVVMRDLRDA